MNNFVLQLYVKAEPDIKAAFLSAQKVLNPVLQQWQNPSLPRADNTFQNTTGMEATTTSGPIGKFHNYDPVPPSTCQLHSPCAPKARVIHSPWIHP